MGIMSWLKNQQAKSQEQNADFHEKQRLAHLATNRMVTQQVRDQAVTDLIALIGEARALKLVGARTRLQARGVVR